MAGLTVCTWLWGTKYAPSYVARLQAGVARHLRQHYRFEVFAPHPDDDALLAVPGCFARLRMFDPDWQASVGLHPGDRLVCLDLDTVITGALDPLFDRDEPFLILQGANASNPCPYNGSVTMLRVGHAPQVWTTFSLEAAKQVPFFEFPDDQGWLAAKLPGAAGWTAGPSSGIYAFKKPGWPKGDALPAGARIVAFPGWRDPSRFADLPWVKEHWRT